VNVKIARKDLVLIGGGHSHAIALRMFALKPLAGVRLTLLTDASESAYSGMLPGHVAGLYSYSECHIDVAKLAKSAGAQLIIDRAIGLDLETQQVFCSQRSPVSFDVLSIDIGSTPNLPPHIDVRHVLPAKPVREFLYRWNEFIEQVQRQPWQPLRLAIVGGGAGGVELALNIQRRLHNILQSVEQPSGNLELHLIHRGSRLLPQSNTRVSDRLASLLTQRGIHVHLKETVETVESRWVRCSSGLALECDCILWVTQASAPDWLARAGLAADPTGFVWVDDTLRSISHPAVFATGDVGTMVNHPRPKAGVFAVRQGKPLFENLRRYFAGQPLRPFRPQRHYLSVLGTADENAIAIWANLSWRSPLLWRLKQFIDRRFMSQF
jgi:selenide, water dikinase